MMSRIRFCMLCLALMVLIADYAFAPPLRIRITGSWTFTIDQNDLTLGAVGGGDLNATYTTSGASNLSVTLSGVTPDTQPWRVDIRRTDSVWSASWILSAKRITDGTGPGTISGGTTFLAITTTDQQFFSGSGDRSSVDVQLQLSGISTQTVEAQVYTTTMTWTLVET